MQAFKKIFTIYFYFFHKHMQIECDYVSINVELLLIFLPKKNKVVIKQPKNKLSFKNEWMNELININKGKYE